MAKRTNRVAWGLVAVLAAVLVVGLAVEYGLWTAGADTVSVFLLPPDEWRFERGIGGANDSAIESVEWIKLGVIRVVKVKLSRSATDPPTSTHTGPVSRPRH